MSVDPIKSDLLSWGWDKHAVVESGFGGNHSELACLYIGYFLLAYTFKVDQLTCVKFTAINCKE